MSKAQKTGTLVSAVEKIAINQREDGEKSGCFFAHPLPALHSEHNTCQEPHYTDKHSASGSAAHSLCPSKLRGNASHHGRSLGPQQSVLAPTLLQRIFLFKIIFKILILSCQALSFKILCSWHLYDVFKP